MSLSKTLIPEYKEQITDAGATRVPPWENALFGVVSLLDMLEFAAADFWEVSEVMGRMIENKMYGYENQVHSQKCFGKFGQHARALGLSVAFGHLKKINEDFENLGDAKAFEKFPQKIESLSSIVHSELDSRKFRYIQPEKGQYCDPDWLVGSKIQEQFPRAFGEFHSAGRCYAYGENTACAFHLNRVLEDGLKALAVTVGQPFHKNSWDAHLKNVERELERRYKAAGARTTDEHFYSDLSTQFGHMKTAWRNPTMHVEAKYDEGDGLYLLQTTERFMHALCERGLRQGDLP